MKCRSRVWSYYGSKVILNGTRFGVMLSDPFLAQKSLLLLFRKSKIHFDIKTQNHYYDYCNNHNRTVFVTIKKSIVTHQFLISQSPRFHLRGYCTPDHFSDCLCIFLKNYNTLVTSKICFL